MRRKVTSGFTLVELMVTVLIIGILIVISLRVYTPQIRKGRRADAIDTLSAMALAEERYRSNNTTYGTLAQVWSGATTSQNGYYTIAISNVAATTYTLTATAIGDQANDLQDNTNCSSISLALSAGTLTKSPSVCWPY